MRLKLYNDLKYYLLHLEDNGNRIFAHADLWNDQLRFIEEEIPFTTPAVFIEFNAIDWTQRNNAQQEANVFVVLHLVTNDPLLALALSEPLHYHMARFSTSYTNRPIRSTSTTDHNHAQLIDDQNGFYIYALDESGSKLASSKLLFPNIINLLTQKS